MKLVLNILVDCGGLMLLSLPSFIHFISHAIFSPRVRIICKPSRSCITSSGVLPWTIFQYLDETTGIDEFKKTRFHWNAAQNNMLQRTAVHFLLCAFLFFTRSATLFLYFFISFVLQRTAFQRPIAKAPRIKPVACSSVFGACFLVETLLFINAGRTSGLFNAACWNAKNKVDTRRLNCALAEACLLNWKRVFL